VSLIEQNATVTGAVRAYVGQGVDLDASGLAILADAPEMKANVQGASITIGGLVGGSDVASSATVNGTVEAFIGAGSSQVASNVTTDVNVGSGAITVVVDSNMHAIANLLGVNGAGLVAFGIYQPTATVSGKTSAFVRDGVNLRSGTLDVSAGKLGGVDLVVNKAEAKAFTVGISLGGTGQNLQAVAQTQGIIEAYIGAADGVAAAGDPSAVVTVTGGANALNISARGDIDAIARTEGGAGSLGVAVGIYKPTAIAGGRTRAYAGDGADLRVSRLNLTADGDALADAQIFNVSVAGAAQVAGLSPTARTTNNVETYVGRNADAAQNSPVTIDILNVAGTGRGNVNAIATGETEARAESTGLGIAGLVGVSVTEAVAQMEGKTRAYIGKVTNLTAGAVNLTATEAKALAKATVTDGSGAGIADVNVLEAKATASRITETFVGRNSIVDLGGANLVGTATTDTGDALANAEVSAVSASGIASVSTLRTTATIGDGPGQASNTRSYIDNGADVTARNVHLTATSDTFAEADVSSVSVSGIASISTTNIVAKAAHDTEAFIGDSVKLTLSGDLEVKAESDSSATPLSKELGIAGGVSPSAAPR
jgi:hypothetical protein